MVAAANAGFSALAANASVSLINNRGDLGAVLKDLGSSQSLKSLATAMVTAGALNGLGFTGTTTEFADRLQQAAMRATVSATISTVVNGGELDDAFVDGLTNAAIMTALASVQHEIGDFGFEHELPEGSIPKMIAHAMAGGLASELAGGKFTDGAMAATLAELTGPLLGGTDLDAGTQVELQRLIGATAVMLRGSDVGGVMFAGGVAASMHEYNYLTHEELRQAREAQAALSKCKGPLARCTGQTIADLEADVELFKRQSWSNTISMLNECEKGSAKCAGMLDAASDFVGEVASDRLLRSFARGYPLPPGAEQFYVSAGDVMGLDTPVNIDALAVEYYGQAVEGDITYKQATEEFGAAALKHESGIKIFLGGVQIAGGLAALTACPITGGLTCATLIGLAAANTTLGGNTVSEGVAQMLSGENERTLIENALIDLGFNEADAADHVENANLFLGIVDFVAGGALIFKGPLGIGILKATRTDGKLVAKIEYAPDSPYQIRVDPLHAARPDPQYSIDTSTFTGSDLTSGGGIRNSKQFWKDWANKPNNGLSEDNLNRIIVRKSPIIDDEWLRVFPEHRDFVGEIIEHHHVEQGRYAIPLPETLHRGAGNTQWWHPPGN